MSRMIHSVVSAAVCLCHGRSAAPEAEEGVDHVLTFHPGVQELGVVPY